RGASGIVNTEQERSDCTPERSRLVSNRILLFGVQSLRSCSVLTLLQGLRCFALLCFVTVLLFTPKTLAQETPADNWSQFRGNERLTGVSESKVSADLKLLWTFEAGESIESSAVIVGGTVFVGSQKG